MASTARLNIISVPADTASIIRGKHLAPRALLDAGLATGLKASGYDLTATNALPDGPRIWEPSSPQPNGARNEAVNVEVYHRVKETVAASLQSNSDDPDDDKLPFQLILGGGCDILPPILSAYHHHPPTSSPRGANIGLIYIDSDTDLQVPNHPSSVGTLASMTMTHLLLHPGSLESMKAFSRPDGKGVVDAESVVLFGTNIAAPGNTKEHLGVLLDGGFKVITSAVVAADPRGKAKEALKWLEERVDYLLVHLDVDAIDAGLFPLANVPNFSGAGFEDVMAALEVFLGSEKAVDLVIAEVNPDHDPGARMTERLVEKVVQFLAARRKT